MDGANPTRKGGCSKVNYRYLVGSQLLYYAFPVGGYQVRFRGSTPLLDISLDAPLVLPFTGHLPQYLSHLLKVEYKIVNTEIICC
jgi:hypothetical protein